MVGKLLRRIAIWPIPPRYSGQAAAIALLTIVGIALGRVHTLPGLLAALLGATIVVLAVQTLQSSRRRAD